MRVPVIKGVIDRRILVNFRVDPDRLRRVLPPSMEPVTLGGFGIAGICLIRLRNIRPRSLPAWLGVSSENAAHRIAVHWGEGDSQFEGVYIPRRDTSSVLNSVAGGRLFPGQHHLAAFSVREAGDTLRVEVRLRSGVPLVCVEARVGGGFTERSLFGSLSEASDFFELGSIGYSGEKGARKLEGLELRMCSWQVVPLEVVSVYSRFFEDQSVFPPGSVELDNALLMRDIEHEWHAREPLYCGFEASVS